MNKLSLVALMASVLAISATTADAKSKHHAKHHHHPAAVEVSSRMMPSAEVIAPGEVLDVYGNPMLTQEDRQDVMDYIGKPLHEGLLAMGAGCGCATPCCPVYECPCIPQCCPDTHGLFDGGLAKTGCNNIQIWGEKVGCCGCNA